MKTCPNCRNQIADEAVFCPICGSGVSVASQYQPQQTPQPQVPYNAEYTQPPVSTIPYVDPYDHTADFDIRDVSGHKVIAMLVYLLGPVGIIMALLAATDSKYANFHVKQGMKLTVAEILGVLALAVAAFILWNIRLRSLMFFLVAVALIGLVVLHLIAFMQVCKGKAKDLYIVRKLRFLN